MNGQANDTRESGRLKLRRPAMETAGIVLAALMIAVLLHAAGKASIRYAPDPVVRSLPASHHAFPLWYDLQLRGRTLVLFARYLRVDTQEADTVSFSEGEFRGSGQLRGFCSILIRDGIMGPSRACSIYTLETLLRSPDLYDRLAQAQTLVLPPFERRLLRMSQGYSPDYERLPADHRISLRKLNRSLLELAYPGICPSHLVYGLTTDNYVFLGIRHRVIRRVYHVIPDNEWAEVSGNLDHIPHAVRSGSGYRVTAAEGVPVVVVRLRDLPAIGEPVIAHVNTDVWLPEELGAIRTLLRGSGFRSDVLTSSGTAAERFLQEVPRDQR